MYLNLGAQPPPSQIVVKRGQSSRTNPITEPSTRAYLKSHPETSHDMSQFRFFPFAIVQKKLLELNPHMLFRPMPADDGRVIIGLDRPSPGAIAKYESLSYYDRKEIDAPGLRETPGPRVWIIAASQSIEPYMELVCGRVGQPHRPLSRALRTIIEACVREGAFTWEAAEKRFGIPLKAVQVKRRHLNLDPAQFFKRNDAAMTLASDPKALAVEAAVTAMKSKKPVVKPKGGV